MKIPNLSVVMTVYNEMDFINQAIDGILTQSFQEFELIIVDDASTDQTPSILNSYKDPRIRIVRNSSNLGPFGAANRGIKMARGDFIARHDADDVSLPKRFEQQLAIFEGHPKLVLLGTSYHMIDKHDHILETSIQPGSNEVLQQLLEKKNVYCHGSIMMRRAALEKIGGYRDYFSASQDYDLFLRLAEVGQIGNLEEPLYLFRFHNKSISRKRRNYQLACRYFALDQAIRRRENKDEQPVPEDVEASYPPKPQDLFVDARGISYLFYVSGNISDATEALKRALEISQEAKYPDNNWDQWLLHRAIAIASLRMDSNAGSNFLSWAASTLTDKRNSQLLKRVLNEYYVQQTFLAYEDRKPARVLANGLAAYRTNTKSFQNRGLGVIILKSLFGRVKD